MMLTAWVLGGCALYIALMILNALTEEVAPALNRIASALEVLAKSRAPQ